MDLLEKEREFCSNFKCCDVKLSDLHALFDHLENCHPGSDICDLSFSVPSGPSSTGAISDVLQIPAPPASSRKLKSLFTRVPLPPIPPVSPITSDSSWSSTPQPPSTPASRPEKPPPPPCVSKYVQGPSALTRDKIYTPVAVPSTLRLDQPPTPLSWSVSAPAAFYPEAMGYGYGYFYYPASPPVSHIPVALPVRAPASSVPANVEIIDVDLISSPPRAAVFPLPDAFVPPTGARSAPTSAPLRNLRTLAPAPPSAPLSTPTSLSPAPILAQASSPTSPSPSTSASAPPPPPLSTPASALPSLALPPPPTASLSQATAANPDSSPSPLPQLRSTSDAPAPSLAVLRNRFFGSARVVASGSGQGDFAIADGQNEDAARAADAVLVDGALGVAADASVVAACDECEARGGNVDVHDVVKSRAPAEASQNQDSCTEERDDNEGSERMNEDAEDVEVEVVMGDGGEFDSIQDAQTLTKPALYLNGREKTFVCPTPLCVKAYLNPGGLRYHARQGTCVMENGQPCPSSLSPSLVDDMLLSASPAPTAPKKANGKRGAAWRRAPGLRTSSRLAPVPEKPTTRTRTSVKATSKAKAQSKSKARATAAKSKSKSKSKSTSTTPAPASPSAYSSRDGYDSEMLSSDEDAEDSD